MARKDLGEMKRASGFQVDFWTALTDETLKLGGTTDHLFGASQERLKAAAVAAARSLVHTPLKAVYRGGGIYVWADYDQPRAAQYSTEVFSHINRNVASIEIEATGRVQRRLELVKLGQRITYGDARAWAAVKGFDLPDTTTALAFAEQHPTLWHGLYVVATGTVWDRDTACVAVFDDSHGQRNLALLVDGDDYVWNEDTWFLLVSN